VNPENIRTRLSAAPFAVLDILTTGSDPENTLLTEIAVVCFEDGHITDADDGVILPAYPAIAEPAGTVSHDWQYAPLVPFFMGADQTIGSKPVIAYDADYVRRFVRRKQLRCCKFAIGAIFGSDVGDDITEHRRHTGNAYRRAVFVGSVFTELMRTIEIAQPHLGLRDFLFLYAPISGDYLLDGRDGSDD
jgi:DNA polymerase III epsilon subunit-like protein